jgi:hypothetical protein
MSVSVPEGWSSKDFGVTLKPGKPPGVMQWQDVQGRPVVKSGRGWKLVPTAKPAATAATQPQAKPEQRKEIPPRLTEKQQERVSNATRSTNNRIARKLGKGPFDDAVDVNSDKYKENIGTMKPYMDLPDESKSAISLYGQDGVQFYALVNNMLRTGSTESMSDEEVEISKFIKTNLQRGLEQLPPSKENLHRVLSGNVVSNLAQLKPGDVYEDKGFGSYTNQERTLGSFIKKDQPNAMISVKSKTARNVSPIMEYDEGEHIALPGTKYKLSKVDKTFVKKLDAEIPHYIFEEVG